MTNFISLIARIIVTASHRIIHAKRSPQLYRHQASFALFTDHPTAYTFHIVTAATFRDSVFIPSGSKVVRVTTNPYDVKISTLVNDVAETSNSIALGDVILCGPKLEFYVLTQDKAVGNYDFIHDNTVDIETSHSVVGMMTKSTLKPFLQVLKEDFDACCLQGPTCRSFTASWGESMTVDHADYIGFELSVVSVLAELLSSSPVDEHAVIARLSSVLEKNIYRIESSIFLTTYEVVRT